MESLKRINFSLIAVSILLFIGCKKGADGVNGKDGSSNVKATTFSVSNWSSNSARWYAQLSVPELTSDNINSAAVQVYFSTANNNWVAMPSTVVSSTNYFWGFLTGISLVEVRWDYNGLGIGSSPNSYYGTTVQIKVVVIPPADRKKNPNLNLNNYQEVKSTYSLQD